MNESGNKRALSSLDPRAKNHLDKPSSVSGTPAPVCYGFVRRSMSHAIWTGMARLWGWIFFIVGSVVLIIGITDKVRGISIVGGVILAVGLGLLVVGRLRSQVTAPEQESLEGIIFSEGELYLGVHTGEVKENAAKATAKVEGTPITFLSLAPASAYPVGAATYLSLVFGKIEYQGDYYQLIACGLIKDGSVVYEINRGSEGYFCLLSGNRLRSVNYVPPNHKEEGSNILFLLKELEQAINNNLIHQNIQIIFRQPKQGMALPLAFGLIGTILAATDEFRTGKHLHNLLNSEVGHSIEAIAERNHWEVFVI